MIGHACTDGLPSLCRGCKQHCLGRHGKRLAYPGCSTIARQTAEVHKRGTSRPTSPPNSVRSPRDTTLGTMELATPPLSPIKTHTIAGPSHHERLTCSCVDRSAGEFQYFISFVVGVCIFGASTLAVVAGEMADPVVLYGDSALFQLQTVRTCFGCAWLYFVLALAVAGYSSSVMTLVERNEGNFSGGMRDRKWELGGIVVATLMHFLMIGGFLCLSLGMAAYVGVVGWTAVGFCAAAAVFVVSLVTFQVAYGITNLRVYRSNSVCHAKF